MGDRNEKRVFASQSGAEEVTGKKPLNGYFTSFIHLVKAYIGTGIFAMGEGFMHSGIIFGPCMLFLIAAINLNCQQMLLKTADRVAQMEGEDVKPSFSETVQYTLAVSKIKCLRNHSKAWGTVTTLFLCFCEMGFCCVYFVFIALHVREIGVNHNWIEETPIMKNVCLLIILGPMWASVFLGNLRLLLPLSIIANILMWIGIVLVIVICTKDGLEPFPIHDAIARPNEMPLFFGVALFAFEGITFVIPLRNEMKEPKKFTAWWGVLVTGMIFVTSLYFFIGFLGYWKYGNDVKSSIFLNVKGQDIILTTVIDVIMSIGVMFTFTLHMYIPFEITFPLFYHKHGPFKRPILVVAIYRSVPVIITWILANAIPFLGTFISLIGATTGSFLALIMPATLELIGFYDEIPVWVVIKDIIIILIGFTGMILGTVMGIIDLVKKFKEEPMWA